MHLLCEYGNVCQKISDLLRTAFAIPLSEINFLDIVTLTIISLEDQGAVVMYTHITFAPIPLSQSREILGQKTERPGVKQYLTKASSRGLGVRIMDSELEDRGFDSHQSQWDFSA